MYYEIFPANVETYTGYILYIDRVLPNKSRKLCLEKQDCPHILMDFTMIWVKLLKNLAIL